jgi:methyl-accepting chemotaxis protein
MKNFKIKTKIIICAAALFLVTIIMAINSLVSIDHILRVQQKIKDFYSAERTSIQDITVDKNNARVAIRDIFLDGSQSEYLDDKDGNILAIGPAREAELDKVREPLSSLAVRIDDFVINRSVNKNLTIDSDAGNVEEFITSFKEYIFIMRAEISALSTDVYYTYTQAKNGFEEIDTQSRIKKEALFKTDFELMQQINQENNDYNNTIIFTNVTLIAIELVFCVVITLVLAGYIANPINKLVEASRQIATGNTPEIDVKASNDEIGQLVNAFKQMAEYINYQIEIMESISAGNLVIKPLIRGENDKLGIALTKMVNSLNVLLYDVSMTASQLAISSRTIADGSINLAQGSTEQASSVEELYTTIERIASRTRDNAELSKNANSLVSVIDSNTKNGVEKMIELVDAVKEIIDSTKDIKHIINFIDNIAFQTNILSLNATIEASNAGEHGKIFTVIADEVHKLASQCADSARQTERIINLTLEKSAYGSKLADSTKDSLVNIADEIEHAKKIIGDIAKASDEQAVAISQINIGIEQVSQVVNYNSHTAEESAKSSEQLALQSARLKSNVSKFQIK